MHQRLAEYLKGLAPETRSLVICELLRGVVETIGAPALQRPATPRSPEGSGQAPELCAQCRLALSCPVRQLRLERN